jgi:hypothetical protein
VERTPNDLHQHLAGFSDEQLDVHWANSHAAVGQKFQYFDSMIHGDWQSEAQ